MVALVAVGLWAAVALLLLLLKVGAPQMGIEEQSLLMRAITQLSQVWIVGGIVGWAIRPLFPLRRWVTSINLVQRVVVGGIGAMFIVAQYAPVKDPYPFVEWSLYTVPTNDVSFMEYRMLSGDTALGHVPFVDLVPGASRTFMGTLSNLVRRAEEGDATARRTVEDVLATYIAELDDPRVDGIEVRECHVEDPTAEQPAECRALMAVTV
jgi:hypothetical protein